MGRTTKEVLSMIPFVDENGDPVSDFTNKNQPLMILENGQVVRGENKKTAMNAMQLSFA